MNIIAIPAYNEEKTIGKVIDEVKKYGVVIVSNDGSKDKTAQIAKEKGAIVLDIPVNMGMGFAIRAIQEYLKNTGMDFDNIVFIDADLQHDARQIPELIEKLKNCDFVMTYRDFSKMPVIKRIGNTIISMFFNILYNSNIKDTQSGFKAFKRDAFLKLNLKARDYFIACDFLIEAIKNRLKICQIKTKTIYLDKYKGTSIVDGFKIMIEMLKYRWFK